MSSQEVLILSWIEHRGGMVTTTGLAAQFGLTDGYANLVVRGLKRNLWIEQDRHSIRITTVGEAALALESHELRPAPFTGRPAW